MGSRRDWRRKRWTNPSAMIGNSTIFIHFLRIFGTPIDIFVHGNQINSSNWIHIYIFLSPSSFSVYKNQCRCSMSSLIWSVATLQWEIERWREKKMSVQLNTLLNNIRSTSRWVSIRQTENFFRSCLAMCNAILLSLSFTVLFCCQCDVSLKEPGYCSSRVRLAVISFEIVCAFFFPSFNSSFALMFGFFSLIFSNWFWLLPSLSDSARLFESHCNEISQMWAKRVNASNRENEWYKESRGVQPSYQTLFEKLNMDEAFLVHFKAGYTVHRTQNTMMHNASIGTIEKYNSICGVQLCIKRQKLKSIAFNVGMLTHTYSLRWYGFTWTHIIFT